MDNPTRTKLKQAYELIKLHDFVAARPLVLDVLKQDDDNVDAWWLAAYVAETPEQKRRALKHVLRFRPDHAPAQEMLMRLEAAEALRPAVYDSAPSTPLVTKPRKSGIQWRVWGLRLFAVLCLNLTGLVLLDNFTGGKILGPIEHLIIGEPDALGWVRADGGGEVPEAMLPREARIPITQEQTLAAYGKIQFGVLRQGEAHVYHFNALRGDQLIIAANFTSKGDPEIIALEVWDFWGNTVANEESLAEMFGGQEPVGTGGMEGQFAGLTSLRVVQYDVIRNGVYALAVVNREGGPSGNYNLIVTTVDKGINSELLEALGE